MGVPIKRHWPTKTHRWHARFRGSIPYGFALYMRPGLFELRDRR
jgi:hypothetical protein